MQCNIDQKGRRARLLTGVITDFIGSGLLIAGLVTGERALIVAGVVVTLIGMFVIFEGAKGWCALRAMGVKTPL